MAGPLTPSVRPNRDLNKSVSRRASPGCEKTASSQSLRARGLHRSGQSIIPNRCNDTGRERPMVQGTIELYAALRSGSC